MINLIHSIKNPAYLDLDSLPASIYWKNKEGIYLGRNLFAAKKMQQANLEPHLDINFILAKSDFDLFSTETAEMYRAHDIEVMKSNRLLVCIEKIRLSCGNVLTQVSSKQPLKNEKGETVGIIGVTFDSTSSLNQTIDHPLVIDNVKLNPRMIKLLQLVRRGKTAKQIAIAFNLSHRTVEHYLANLKKKFNVCSKADLIDKVANYLI